MAAGDIAIYKEAVGGQGVTDSWAKVSLDTEVKDSAGTFSQSGGTITLPESGKYLVFYCLGGIANGGSNRTQLNGRLVLNGTTLSKGGCSGYIRRADGIDECIPFGAAIIEPSVANETLEIEASLTGDASGMDVWGDHTIIHILKLDDTHAYFEGGTTDADPFRDLVDGANEDFVDDNTGNPKYIRWTSEAEKDSGFTHDTASNEWEVTLDGAGHYLVVVGMWAWTRGTDDRFYPEMRVEIDGVQVPGKFPSVYCRNQENIIEGPMNGLLLIETTSANQKLRIHVQDEDGARGNLYSADHADNTYLQLWKIPSGGEYLRVHAGSNFSLASPVGDVNEDFTYWDTEDEDDFTGFTTGDAFFTAPADDDYLNIIGFGGDGGQAGGRAQVDFKFEINDSGVYEAAHGTAFIRADFGSKTFKGQSAGIISLNQNDTLTSVYNDLGNQSEAEPDFENDDNAWHVLRLGSIFAGGGGSAYSKALTPATADALGLPPQLAAGYAVGLGPDLVHAIGLSPQLATGYAAALTPDQANAAGIELDLGAGYAAALAADLAHAVGRSTGLTAGYATPLPAALAEAVGVEIGLIAGGEYSVALVPAAAQADGATLDLVVGYAPALSPDQANAIGRELGLVAGGAYAAALVPGAADALARALDLVAGYAAAATPGQADADSLAIAGRFGQRWILTPSLAQAAGIDLDFFTGIVLGEIFRTGVRDLSPVHTVADRSPSHAVIDRSTRYATEILQ